MKKQATAQEKMFTIHVSNKYPKYIKNSYNPKKDKVSNFVKRVKDGAGTSPGKNGQQAHESMLNIICKITSHSTKNI